MPDSTPIFGLHFPEGADPANAPADFEALALDVEAELPVRSKGKSIIAAEQTRSAGAYGYLGTEDKVTGIVLPTDGLIVVAFHAKVKCSVLDQGYVALFLGAQQVKVNSPAGGAPVVHEVNVRGADAYQPVVTYGGGLAAGPELGAGDDVTTGQLVAAHTSGDDYGGVCHIFAAAGTYEIGIKFKQTSGTITAKQRKLWAWSLLF